MSKRSWLDDAGVCSVWVHVEGKGEVFYRVSTTWGVGTISSRDVGDNPSLRGIVAAFYEGVLADDRRSVADPSACASRYAIEARIAGVTAVLATMRKTAP